MRTLYTAVQTAILLSVILLQHFTASANPEFEARRQQYIQDAILRPNSDDVITIQAYKGVPVDQNLLTAMLNNIPTRSTVDFDIVKLIRVLFLSNGEYDSQILPVLEPIPFWLTPGENQREYWSENHMIMWMSSDWLLHEKYGKAIDSTLERRLRHYLRLKNQYGFYEFYSSTYLPYCFSGLVNLADFAEDAEIKSLATQASQKILQELLLLTNDRGSYFPAAGRNYYGKYETPFLQNHNHLIYLLTGRGTKPTTASHAGGFLATTTIDVQPIIDSYSSSINTVVSMGHTLLEGIRNINNNMTFNDRVIFQWSSGGYFHPDVAQNTFQFVKVYNMWDHFQFNDFRQFSVLPTELATAAANIASPISKGSVISGQDVAIYKHKTVTLSSTQDLWKGKKGYQLMPVVANTGTTAVMTASGKVIPNWDERPSLDANTHLPYVQQKDNVALVMYRPDKGLSLFNIKDDKLDVSLFYKPEAMDEIREYGNWWIAREGDGYVAVRRYCMDMVNNIPACKQPDGQTWVIMVGHLDTHGSFDAFVQTIEQSKYEERWYFDLPTLQWIYFAKVVVDGKTLQYAWNGDIFSGPTQTATAIQNNRTESNALTVFPNPANDHISLVLADNYKNAQLQIVNSIGNVVYRDEINGFTGQIKTISTGEWAAGMYMLMLESEGVLYTQSVVKQ